MTIDERLEALTQSVELLASMHKDNETRMAAAEERERRGRMAILGGIRAYLEALTEDGGEAGE